MEHIAKLKSKGENTYSCFAFLQLKASSLSDHTVKDHHEQAVLNQYLARHWAASFREEISNLVGAKSVRMEDLMGMF